jgi:hypothetical protein
VDALATVQVFDRGSARAPMMQAIYRLIRDLPEYLRITHVAILEDSHRKSVFLAVFELLFLANLCGDQTFPCGHRWIFFCC